MVNPVFRSGTTSARLETANFSSANFDGSHLDAMGRKGGQLLAMHLDGASGILDRPAVGPAAVYPVPPRAIDLSGLPGVSTTQNYAGVARHASDGSLFTTMVRLQAVVARVGGRDVVVGMNAVGPIVTRDDKTISQHSKVYVLKDSAGNPITDPTAARARARQLIEAHAITAPDVKQDPVNRARRAGASHGANGSPAANPTVATGRVAGNASRRAAPASTPFLFDPVIWTAFGANRPLSNVAEVGRNGVKAMLNGVPEAASILNPILDAIHPGSAPGQSDPLRFEVNTVVEDKSSVLHAKLNLSQLIKLGQPSSDQIFKTLLSKATTPAQKAEVLFYKNMVDNGFRQPGFADGRFAKTTDLRLTFDIAPPKGGFRMGVMMLPMINKISGGDNGVEGSFAISPRIRFDDKGRITGFQLLTGYEVDSPKTKNGFWAGLGVGAALEWRGSLSNSPIRRNAQGQLGIEVKLGGKPRFIQVPGLGTTIENMGMGDVKSVRSSSASGLKFEEIAKEYLHTDDPQVIEGIKKGATLAEKAGLVISDVSQGMSTLAAVSGISLGSIFAAAALAVPLALAWEDPLANDTLDGVRKHFYAQDVKSANQALQTVRQILDKPGRLNPSDRASLKSAQAVLSGLSNKYSHSADLSKFYSALPANARFPWQASQLKAIAAAVASHPSESVENA